MALITPAWVTGRALNPANTFRSAGQSMLSGTGVRTSADLLVAQTTPSPNMGVKVSPGSIWIPGTQGFVASPPPLGVNLGNQNAVYSALPADFTSQGSYWTWNSIAVGLVIAAADPTNARKDLICAAIQDADYSGSFNQALLQVITGTPAGSPVAPNPPANSVVLAEIHVPANALSIVDADITDRRPIAGGMQSSFTGCRIYTSGAFSISVATTKPSGTPFNTVNFDTTPPQPGGATAGYNTTTQKFAPGLGGYWLITGGVELTTASALGLLEVAMVKNGTDNISTGLHSRAYFPSGSGADAQVSDIYHLNGTTDYIELRVGTNGSTESGLGVIAATYLGP